MYLSSDAYKNIIAQAVVLGGFYIIVMLKNDLEYLLVGCTPAEEEERLKAAHVIGTSQCLCLSKLELVLTCCLYILCTAVHLRMDVLLTIAVLQYVSSSWAC